MSLYNTRVYPEKEYHYTFTPSAHLHPSIFFKVHDIKTGSKWCNQFIELYGGGHTIFFDLSLVGKTVNVIR